MSGDDAPWRVVSVDKECMSCNLPAKPEMIEAPGLRPMCSMCIADELVDKPTQTVGVLRDYDLSPRDVIPDDVLAEIEDELPDGLELD